MDRRIEGVGAAREGVADAARPILALQQQDVPPRLREEGGGGEPAEPRTDDDHIVLIRSRLALLGRHIAPFSCRSGRPPQIGVPCSTTNRGDCFARCSVRRGSVAGERREQQMQLAVEHIEQYCCALGFDQLVLVGDFNALRRADYTEAGWSNETPTFAHARVMADQSLGVCASPAPNVRSNSDSKCSVAFSSRCRQSTKLLAAHSFELSLLKSNRHDCSYESH